MSLYLFFSSAPGGTSAMVTRLDGMDYKERIRGGSGGEEERESGREEEIGNSGEGDCERGAATYTHVYIPSGG